MDRPTPFGSRTLVAGVLAALGMAVLPLGSGALRRATADPGSLAPGVSLPRVGTIGDQGPEQQGKNEQFFHEFLNLNFWSNQREFHGF